MSRARQRPFPWRLQIVVAALVLVMIGAAVLPGRPAEAATTHADAVSNLADCSARTGRMSVLFLVDESASLQRTDKENHRVDGIQAALAGLAQVADRTAGTERPVAIEVSLMGFGRSTTEVSGWAALDGGRLPGLIGTSQQFAQRNNEIDTDYAAAMIGAREQLQKVIDPTRPGSTCSAVIWFTDGEYDIEPRSTGETKSYAPEITLSGPESAVALEQAGKDTMCKDSGVVDGLRQNGTEILAVALATDISPENQDFLRAVAEGSAGSQRCGAARGADDPVPGAYLGTADVSKLIAGFFDLVNGLAGGTRDPAGEGVPACPNTRCDAGTHKFAVDAGIGSFNLLALTSVEGIEVEIQSAEPGSAPVLLVPTMHNGETKAGAAQLRWTWVAADSVLVDVELPADSGPWNGEWAVTFVDRHGTAPNAVGDARIYVFGDIEPYVRTPDFRAGELQDITFGVRHRKGSPVNEDLFAKVDLDSVVVNPNDGTRDPVALAAPGADGTRHGTWKAPAPEFPATANVSVTARITTVSGQALAPVTRTFPIRVLPPSSYPTVAPVDLGFPSVTGTDATTAVVKVRGGASSGGCVWLEGSSVLRSPQDAGPVVVRAEPSASSKATCIKVDANQEKDLLLEVAPTSGANGSAAGNVDLALVSDTNGDLLHTTVAWQVPLEKPLDKEKAVTIFLLLMAGGMVLPLLLMWLMNWLTAGYAAPSDLKVARIGATVSSTGSVHREGRAAAGLGVESSDFAGMDGSKRVRSFEERGLRFTSHTSASPFAAPSGRVEVDGMAVGTAPPASIGAELSEAPVAFGLAGTVVVMIPLPVLDAAIVPQPVLVGAVAAAPGLGQRRSLPPEPTGIGSHEAPDLRDVVRPELDIELVLFADAGHLARYGKHFDAQREGIAAVVDALWNKRVDQLRRAQDQTIAEAGAKPTRSKHDRSEPPGSLPPDPSTAVPPTRASARGAPPRRSTVREAPPASSRSDDAGPPRPGAGSTPPPPSRSPKPSAPRPPSTPNDDPFGPPPIRRR